jgi:tetratricopeptide (TPR) repeat protein
MTMGDDHPITAATSASLALALSKEGKYQDAEPLYKLAIRVLSHTRQRQAVPEIMNEYANCLIKLGRKGEAANIKAQAQALAAAK